MWQNPFIVLINLQESNGLFMLVNASTSPMTPLSFGSICRDFFSLGSPIMPGKPTGTCSFKGRQCRFRCGAEGSHDLSSRSPPANSVAASTTTMALWFGLLSNPVCLALRDDITRRFFFFRKKRKNVERLKDLPEGSSRLK